MCSNFRAVHVPEKGAPSRPWSLPDALPTDPRNRSPRVCPWGRVCLDTSSGRHHALCGPLYLAPFTVLLRFTQGSVHLFPLLLFHKHIRSDVLFVMNTQASTGIEHKDDCCCCSVTKSRLTLCDPMDCSTPVFPALHYLQEFAQTHVH